MAETLVMAEELIINRIHLIRGKKVMLDYDLAEMYSVETKQLKRHVRRNIERFPADFMFELTSAEFENLRSQNGTSRWGGARYMPMAFTEQGVAMLSSVLSSPTAIEVNIQIIRVFTRMREMLSTHKDILIKLENIEKELLKHDARMNDHEADIQAIFQVLKRLVARPDEKPRPRIGFRRANEKD